MATKYSKAELVKFGLEGFGMVEESYGRSSRGRRVVVPPKVLQEVPRHQSCMYQYQPQQPQLYQIPSTKSSDGVLDSYQAAKLYDGMLIVDYPPKTKPASNYYF
ncbi:hypothetical protein LguiA_001051 [Lonicera macranthoides]